MIIMMPTTMLIIMMVTMIAVATTTILKTYTGAQKVCLMLKRKPVHFTL